jgi:DNA-binding SARP family transcriptional activator/tetratricopeptide (TPR) repeat protein/TolB-like protein
LATGETKTPQWRRPATAVDSDVETRAAIRLRLLGSPDIRGPGGRIALTGKPLALLCYLAARPDGVRREQLAALLWSEADEHHARQSLRQALLRLRQDLGSALEVSGDLVSLVPGAMESDVARFEKAVAAGRFSEAVTRWTGDFMAEGEAAASEALRAWIEGERERLRRLVIVALRSLVDAADRDGADAVEAARWLARWIEIAPLDEAPHRRMVENLRRRGLTEEAAALHADYCTLVRRELDAAPSSEFMGLAVSLRTAAPRTPGSPPRASTPVPANPQLAALDAIWRKIGDAGASVVLEGDDADSRSLILREFTALAGARRPSSIVFETVARSQDVAPLSTARRLFRRLSDAPGLAGTSPSALAAASALVPQIGEQFKTLPAVNGDERLADALREVLAAVAFESPVLVSVDDVVHADAMSLDLLVELLTAPPAGTMVAIAASRDAMQQRVFASVTHGAVLQRVPVPIAMTIAVPPERSSRSRRPWLLAAAAVGAVVLGHTLWLQRPAPSAGAERRIVALRFQNETGDLELDALGRLAADMVSRSLSSSALLLVANPQLQFSPDSSDRPAVDKAREAAQRVGAAFVVWGSYGRDGDSIRFRAHLADVSKGLILRSLDPVSAGIGNPVAALEGLQSQLVTAVADWIDPRIAGSASVRSHAPSLEAYRRFSAGLDYDYRRDGMSALRHYLAAYELDTTWTLPLLYVAGVHRGHVNLPAMDSVVRRLMPRRSTLAPYDRHMLDVYVAGLAGDGPGVLAAARSAAQLAPHSRLAAVDLPFAALALNRPNEALAYLEAVDLKRSEARDMPAYYSALSSALHMLGQYERQLSMARALRQQLPGEMRALFYQARALSALGRFAELEKVLAEGFELAPNALWGPHGMRMHVAAADELRAHGHPDMARTVLERALAFYAVAPEDIRSIPKHQFDVAQALHRLGRLAEARSAFERLLAGPPVMGADSMTLFWNLGIVVAMQKDTTRAAEIEDWFRNRRGPYLYGLPMWYRASIQAVLGNREEAVQLLVLAAAAGRGFESTFHTVPEYALLAGYAPFDAYLRPKK